MKKFKYTFQGEMLGLYRQTTIGAEVESMDPDGFIATEEQGDYAIMEIDTGDGYLHDEWQDGGHGKDRRLFWDDECLSLNDDGQHATGEITREEIS